jgi:hypothetical protein
MLTIRRLAVAGLPLMFAAGLAVTGCTATSNTPQPAASGSPTASSSTVSSAAKDTLVASAAQLTQTSYKYKVVSSGLTVNGSADPTKKAAMASLTGTSGSNTLAVDMVTLNTDIWLKLNLGADNKTLGISSDKWTHVDATRLGANPALPVDPQGGAQAANALFAGLTSVQSTDNKNFTGTLDLTKATGSSAVTADLLSRAGVKANSLPFTATLDDQGRLTDFKVDLSSIDPSLSLETTYSDYGTPVTVTRPDAASVVEAPDSVYQLFAPR